MPAARRGAALRLKPLHRHLRGLDLGPQPGAPGIAGAGRPRSSLAGRNQGDLAARRTYLGEFQRTGQPSTSRSSSVEPSCTSSSNHSRRSVVRVAAGASSKGARAHSSAVLSSASPVSRRKASVSSTWSSVVSARTSGGNATARARSWVSPPTLTRTPSVPARRGGLLRRHPRARIHGRGDSQAAARTASASPRRRSARTRTAASRGSPSMSGLGGQAIS